MAKMDVVDKAFLVAKVALVGVLVFCLWAGFTFGLRSALWSVSGVCGAAGAALGGLAWWLNRGPREHGYPGRLDYLGVVGAIWWAGVLGVICLLFLLLGLCA